MPSRANLFKMNFRYYKHTFKYPLTINWCTHMYNPQNATVPQPIGEYTFEEYKELARAFHGYPAPGLLIGGYMVEKAKASLEPGTLFEAVVETQKCLPDAVQLLTPCSIGNGWIRIVNLGRYALSLYDKYTGQGWRVWIDPDQLTRWPEI